MAVVRYLVSDVGQAIALATEEENTSHGEAAKIHLASWRFENS
jgi:hypothetical protein